ncbi:MAG: glycoside hydrolase family 99-like domain-containing protein [Candidatus Bathyarchaeia archaeon]|jgi:hypothetical protein
MAGLASQNSINKIALRLAVVILLVVCLMDFPALADAGAVTGQGPNSRSQDLYRVVMQVTTTSDWTNVKLAGGAEVADLTWKVLNGSEQWFGTDLADGLLAEVTKKQFDMTNASMEITFIVTSIQDGTNATFLVCKGEIGMTNVTLYNFNTNEKNLITSIPNTQMAASFSLTSVSLTQGGPLTDTSDIIWPSRLVWAFYYPWYGVGTDWSDPKLKDQPLAEPNSSGDEGIILAQIRMAKAAGIDGFIFSWEPTENADLQIMLRLAAQENFKVTIYFESECNYANGTRDGILGMFRTFFSNFGNDQRYFRLNGRPVIFVYAVDSQPLAVWEDILLTLKSEGHEGFYIAESADTSYLEAFDGIHIYEPNTPSQLQTLNVTYRGLQLRTRSFEFLHPNATRKLWAATFTPGFNDTLLQRNTTHVLPRDNGNTFRESFNAAVGSDPDWILITSFNEWHENTYVEPSVNYGWNYLYLTAQLSATFHNDTVPSLLVVQRS